MGCNCNNGCNGMLAVMQNGDTMPIQLKLKDGDAVAHLDTEDGYDLVIGIYDKERKLLVDGSIGNGRVTYSDGVYTMTVSHEESLVFGKKVYIELSVTKGGNDEVYHGDKVLAVWFDPRSNNEIIDENNN